MTRNGAYPANGVRNCQREIHQGTSPATQPGASTRKSAVPSNAKARRLRSFACEWGFAVTSIFRHACCILAAERNPRAVTCVILRGTMSVIISMLRGVNVGGHNKIKMDELRAVYGSLGFRDAQTYIQSGNVVCRADKRDLATVCTRIEKGIERNFGFRPSVIVRTAPELREVIVRNPFARRSGIDASRLLVAFLASSPAADALDKVLKIKCRAGRVAGERPRTFYLLSEWHGAAEIVVGDGGTHAENFFDRAKLEYGAEIAGDGGGARSRGVEQREILRCAQDDDISERSDYSCSRNAGVTACLRRRRGRTRWGLERCSCGDRRRAVRGDGSRDSSRSCAGRRCAA